MRFYPKTIARFVSVLLLTSFGNMGCGEGNKNTCGKCDDGIGCTQNSCYQETGECVYIPDDALCPKGSRCVVGTGCLDENECMRDSDCNDDNPCTDDSCDPFLGCLYTANRASCDDQNRCTESDSCRNASCEGVAIECDDNNICTDDGCDPSIGCTYTNNTTPCDDENACTNGDKCTKGDCVPGTNICECEVFSDCAQYEDGNLCNGTLFCEEKFCVVDPETLVVCDDSQDLACRKNNCVPETGNCEIQDLPPTSGCDDDNDCTTGDYCEWGDCQPGQETCCEDKLDNDNDGTTDCDDTEGCSHVFACQDWEIAWCRLHYPATAEEEENSQLTIYGWVFVPSLTEPPGANPSTRLLGQAGVGPDGTMPNQGGWNWFEATPNETPAVPTGDNDEYMGDILVPPASGSPYDVAYRFSGDSGQSWIYCDLDAGEGQDGSENGYQVENAGHLVSTPETACEGDGECIPFDDGDKCNGIWTCQYSVCAYDPTTVVSCPEKTDCLKWTCHEETGDCGSEAINPGGFCDDEDPCTEDTSCTEGQCQDGKEICCGDDVDNDGDGNTSCLDEDCAQDAACAVIVGWCNLQYPESVTETTGSVVTFYGRVWVEGLTDKSLGADPLPSLVGELGYGTQSDLGDFIWQLAEPNFGFVDSSNDEYMVELTLPAPGNYRTAYRFSGDGGQRFLYCDTNPGATSEETFGFDDTGVLIVNPTRHP